MAANVITTFAIDVSKRKGGPVAAFSDEPDTLVYEHPVVLPHVSHFMQVPLRTKVKLPHSPHASPS